MDMEKQLEEQGYLENDRASYKYRRNLKTLCKSIVDYGYFNEVIPMENVGKNPTIEMTAIKVLSDQKENFEQAMLDMNIALKKENKIGTDGKESEFYTFRSSNLPELKQLVRGIVKIKNANALQLQNISSRSR